MSQSKHFVEKSLRQTRSSKQVANTFETELKKFDTEIKQIRETIVKAEKNNELPPLIFQPKKGKERRSIKHIKLEENSDVEFEEPKVPDNFFPIYNKIKEMRKLIITPVDLIGCVEIPGLLRIMTNKFKETKELLDIPVNEISAYKEQIQVLEETQVDKFWRYQLLVTLLFSSQTKDETNYDVMKNLHHHYLNAGYPEGLCIQAIMDSSVSEIDKLIFKVGFHSRKAVYLSETTRTLHENYNNDIPNAINELVKLRGIGNKMGHLILQGAWNKVDGISVDTHMVRLCNMFGWTHNEKNPDNTRKELEKMLSNYKNLWLEINPVLVGFGQSVCTPTGRRCDLCLLSKVNEKNDYLCPAVDKRLLLKVKRGVEKTGERKIRGDLSKLVEYINS